MGDTTSALQCGAEEGKGLAPGGEGAGGAFGITGGAGVATVKYEPVMGYGPKLRGNMPFKVLLYGKRS